MNTDLQKRLEEAALQLFPHESCNDALTEELRNGVIDLLRKAFIQGAKLGYKEAITRAKEWLENNINNYLDTLYSDVVFDEELLTDFEADINKFWEEKK